jgi:hypothetical protein
MTPGSTALDQVAARIDEARERPTVLPLRPPSDAPAIVLLEGGPADVD